MESELSGRTELHLHRTNTETAPPTKGNANEGPAALGQCQRRGKHSSTAPRHKQRGPTTRPHASTLQVHLCQHCVCYTEASKAHPKSLNQRSCMSSIPVGKHFQANTLKKVMHPTDLNNNIYFTPRDKISHY